MESSNYYKPKGILGPFGERSKISSIFGSLKRPSPVFKAPHIKISRKVTRVILYVFISILIILAIFFIVVGIPLLGLYRDAMVLKNQARSLRDAMSEQNLTSVEESLSSLREEVSSFEGKYDKRLSIVKNLPLAKEYYDDGKHLLKAANYALDLGSTSVAIVKPFAGDIGFKVEGSEFEGNELTNQERLIKILKILPEFSEQIDEIAQTTRMINEELSQIDETKYPESIKGVKVKSQIISAKTVSHELAEKSPQFRELFNALPVLMGLNGPKVYMVNMANNYELRMSGGFHTFLVLFKIDNGMPQILGSMDTYDIDRDYFYMVNFNVPSYIRSYLKLTRLYARDATSTSPDFVEASNKFLNEFWRKNGSLYQKIDGVMQVDNFVVEDLLRVLGPVDSGGYSVRTDEGNYIGIPIKEFTADNVIYELERISGGELKEIIGRKDIIRYLMDSIMQKTLNASSENLLPLAQVFLKLLSSKDIMIYSFDPEIQTALEHLNYSGRIISVPETWDFLHVNNSNFGAGKRDWIVKRKVYYEVYEENGVKTGVVKLTITNPKSPDWWNWALFYNDYFRFYVPKGAKLISSEASDGQELNAKEYEHLEKTVFEGFFKMPEDSTITVTYRYSLPSAVDLNSYNLLIQKQPGTRGDVYEVKKGEASERFELLSDKKLSL